MADRIVRDELLTSERYWRCAPEARNLFLSILLTVDDAARMSASNFVLRQRCMAGTVGEAHIERLLLELVDADLVRVYEVAGARYIFVPRFRNRRRYMANSKHPPPPTEINDMMEKKADSGRTQDSPKADQSQPQDERGRGRGRGGVGVKPTRGRAHEAGDKSVDNSAPPAPGASPDGEKSKPVQQEKVKTPVENEALQGLNRQPGAVIQDKAGENWGTLEDLLLARDIFQHLKTRAGGKLKSPQWHKWANDVRLMREAGRTIAEARILFNAAVAHPQWSRRILCPAHLSRHWDALAGLTKVTS